MSMDTPQSQSEFNILSGLDDMTGAFELGDNLLLAALENVTEMLNVINDSIIDLGGGGRKPSDPADPSGGPGGKKETKQLKGVFDILGKGLKAALGPLGFLVGILEAMGVLEPIFEIFGAFMDILGVAFLPLTEMLIDVFLDFMPVIELIADAIEPVIQIIADNLKPIFESLMPVFMAIVSAIIPIISILIPFIDLFMVLKDAFNPFLFILPLIILPFQLFGDALNLLIPLITPVLDFITGISDGLSIMMSSLKDVFSDFIGNIGEWIMTGVKDFDFEEIGETIWGSIKDFFKFKKNK